MLLERLLFLSFFNLFFYNITGHEINVEETFVLNFTLSSLKYLVWYYLDHLGNHIFKKLFMMHEKMQGEGGGGRGCCLKKRS